MAERYFDEETGQWLDKPDTGPSPGPGTPGYHEAPPKPPVVYRAPQVQNSNVYNPNGDFITGNANPRETMPDETKPDYVPPKPAATTTTTTTTGNSTLDWVNSMGAKYALGHPAQYWVDAIEREGGFQGRHDQAYWENRIKQGESYIGAGPSGPKPGGFKLPSVASLTAGLAAPLAQWGQAPELDNQAIQAMMTQPATTAPPATAPAASPFTLPPGVQASLDAMSPEDRQILLQLLNRG